MRRKKLLCILVAFAGLAFVVSCIGIGKITADKRNKIMNNDKYAVYTSTIKQEDCYLCGDNPNSSITPYLGESNIGLINLNTFDCFRFEVNRYNDNHEPIEKLAKYGTSHGWRGDDKTGSTFDYIVYCNKGYLNATVRFNDNSDLQIDRIQTFLCNDCLEIVMQEYWSGERYLDIALIDYKDGKIQPFNESVVGTCMSDYYISMQYTEHGSLNLLAFYCPDRYNELDYDPNISITEEITQYCNDNNFTFTLNDEVKDFLSGFEKIGGISYSDNSVTFQNESFIGSKELTINKDGTYDIFDLDILEE